MNATNALDLEKELLLCEDSGLLDRDCVRCAPVYEALRAGKKWPPGPAHRPSTLCRSGSRAHCSCEACF